MLSPAKWISIVPLSYGLCIYLLHQFLQLLLDFQYCVCGLDVQENGGLMSLDPNIHGLQIQ